MFATYGVDLQLRLLSVILYTGEEIGMQSTAVIGIFLPKSLTHAQFLLMHNFYIKLKETIKIILLSS